MTWNYRICQYEVAGRTVFGIREVYYGQNGELVGVAAASVNDWDSAADLKRTTARMRRAFNQPILRLDSPNA